MPSEPAPDTCYSHTYPFSKMRPLFLYQPRLLFALPLPLSWTLYPTLTSYLLLIGIIIILHIYQTRTLRNTDSKAPWDYVACLSVPYAKIFVPTSSQILPWNSPNNIAGFRQQSENDSSTLYSRIVALIQRLRNERSHATSRLEKSNSERDQKFILTSAYEERDWDIA